MKNLIIPTFTEPQKQFLQCESDEVGYGGAKGGGKSFVVDWKAVFLALKWEGIQILLLRRTYLLLYQNHIKQLQNILHSQSDNRNEHIAEFNTANREFKFPNGSRIVAGYYDSEDDKYQGNQFDVIFIEEATTFSEIQYNYIRTWSRSSGLCKPKYIEKDGETKLVYYRPKIFYTANPGGIGHQWFKKKFIDNENVNKPGSNISFIQASVYDNNYIVENDPNYIKRLEELPDKLKQAYLYGDWNVLEGGFFPEFDIDRHVIEPFSIPSHWKIYRSRDYGFDMLDCGWFAIDEYGCAYMYMEISEPNLIISKAGDLINKVNMGRKISLDLAPPDLFSRNKVDYRTTVDVFREECGQRLVKASNDFENGCNAIREWLANIEIKKKRLNSNGQWEEYTEVVPKLRIFSNCKSIIHDLPLICFDEKNPNVYAKTPHELTHSVDMLRYFCISWNTPSSEPETDKEDNFFIKLLKEDRQERNKNKGRGYCLWD